MERPPGRDRQVLVHGLPQQVVREHQPLTVLEQYATLDQLPGCRHQCDHRLAEHHAHLAQGEAPPEDRSDLQQPAPVRIEPAQAGPGTRREAGRQSRRSADLLPYVSVAAALPRLVLDGRAADGFDDQERVPLRAPNQVQQWLVRCPAKKITRQRTGSVLRQRPEPDAHLLLTGKLGQQGRELVADRGATAGQQPSDGYRRQLGRERSDRPEGRRFGPLQVVDRYQYGTPARLLLQSCAEPVEEPEPLVGELGQAGHVVDSHQGRFAVAERVEQGSQRRDSAQLVGPGAGHHEAVPGRQLRGLGQHPTLADAGRALEDGDTASPRTDAAEPITDHGKLVVASVQPSHRTPHPGCRPVSSARGDSRYDGAGEGRGAHPASDRECSGPRAAGDVSCYRA